MGTATILGTEYATVIMPDGKEWMAENLAWDGLGQWYAAGASNNGAGRYYTPGQLDAINTALAGTGWRVPERLNDLDPLETLLSSSTVGMKSTTGWISNNGTNSTGLNVVPWGYRDTFGHWYAFGEYGTFWVRDAVNHPSTAWPFTCRSSSNVFDILDLDVGNRLNIRLVREPVPPPPPEDRAESVSYDYRLALDWDTALDGTPICIDDGATYDYIESTITMRLTPTELAEWEAAWEGNGIVYPPGTGRLLGPTVDHSGADIACTLQDFVIDGPADSAMTLFDVTARLHYNGLGTPSAGSPSPLMDRGVPYHAIRPGYRSIILDSGAAAVVPYSGASTRITKWYSSGLTLSEAQDAINWLRTLRGSQYAWTVGGTGFPFGPSESQTNTIWIPAWRCLRESNFTYGFELEIVLDG